MAEEEKKKLTKEEKAEAKARAKEEKARAKEQAREAKEKEKADRAAAKEAAKSENRETRDRAAKTDAPSDEKGVPVFLKIYLGLVIFALLSIGAYFFVDQFIIPRVHLSKVEQKMQDIRDTRAAENQVGILVNLKEIITNTYGSTRRYLQAEIAVEVKTEEIAEEVLNREGRFRDSIIAYLRSFSAAEVASPEFPPKAKIEIKRIINNNLSVGWIDSVFFTELIVN